MKRVSEVALRYDDGTEEVFKAEAGDKISSSDINTYRGSFQKPEPYRYFEIVIYPHEQPTELKK